jgi:hypothetical protein
MMDRRLALSVVVMILVALAAFGGVRYVKADRDLDRREECLAFKEQVTGINFNVQFLKVSEMLKLLKQRAGEPITDKLVNDVNDQAERVARANPVNQFPTNRPQGSCP